MIKIAHRVNTLEHLATIERRLGVEIDIRPYKNDLVVHHDPFVEALSLNSYLENYEHSFLIANVKSEGIENRVIEFLDKYGIQDYFLLDATLPRLVQLSESGFNKMAVRYSEYEPLEFTLSFAGKVNWVWVDCFTKLPLNGELYDMLKEHFKICLVSPELQGHDIEMIGNFKDQIENMRIDAVCTKRTDLW